jgi:hypothetical protein
MQAGPIHTFSGESRGSPVSAQVLILSMFSFLIGLQAHKAVYCLSRKDLPGTTLSNAFPRNGDSSQRRQSETGVADALSLSGSGFSLS